MALVQAQSLKIKLQATKKQQYARALFQLLLLGSYKAEDADVQTGVGNVRLQFGLNKNRCATKDEIQIYFECLWTIVQCDFILEDLMEETNVHSDEGKAWLIAFSDLDSWIWSETQSFETHVCWQLARDVRNKNVVLGDRETQHVFLVLWCFWVMKNHRELPNDKLPVNLLGLQDFITAQKS